MLHELFALPLEAQLKSFRLTGWVDNLDIERRSCTIQHNENILLVDLSLIDLSIPQTGGLCQVLGEIKSVRTTEPKEHGGSRAAGELCLAASIMRMVEGLDLNLFERALIARRQFLQAQRCDAESESGNQNNPRNRSNDHLPVRQPSPPVQQMETVDMTGNTMT